MPSKRRNPQKQAVVAAMQTFSADGKLHASMSMVLDSFRVRVHNTVDNSLVVDYKHQETAKCHGLYLDNDLLAICLDSGSVLLYSIVQGSISTLTGLASPCVDFAIGKTHCYALGSNGTLIEYESKSGASTRTLATKKACSTLAISKKYLALGGNQIDLVDLKTFKGHATLIQGMMIQSDELFSCAMNDRFVSRWSLVNKSLVCCYSAGSVAESLSVSKHVLACKLESGLIAYWSLDSDNITGSIDPTGSIELNCPGSDADVFLSCKAQKEDRILVAYGNEFKDSQGAFMESLVLTRLSKTPQPKFERAKKVGKSLKVLGAEDIQDIPQDFQEPTLQEKIDALEVGDGKVQSKERTEMSLSQLLSQAIHSDDIELLEKALSVADRNMINATIRRLSPTQVPHLMKRLGALYRILSIRQETLSKLDKLSGRLDMIIFQTAPAEAHEQDPDTVVFDDDEEHEMELDSEMSSDGEMDAEMSENEL